MKTIKTVVLNQIKPVFDNIYVTFSHKNIINKEHGIDKLDEYFSGNKLLHFHYNRIKGHLLTKLAMYLWMADNISYGCFDNVTGVNVGIIYDRARRCYKVELTLSYASSGRSYVITLLDDSALHMVFIKAKINGNTYMSNNVGYDHSAHLHTIGAHIANTLHLEILLNR